MKEVLNRLVNHQSLSESEAKSVLIQIGKGEVNPAQITMFMSVYLMRPITVQELRGFRSALLELCIPIDFKGIPSIDMCGTGGDGKNTFNISTISAFIAAGAGVKVSKHGNYGVSSHCGSSNVLEYLGYQFTNDNDTLLRQLENHNICILHAPLFHPAMKEVAPIRRELGMKTFFNMLGPIVNPCQPSFQSVGVFNLEIARLYKYLFQEIENDYSIMYSMDGYDEVSLTGDIKWITNSLDRVVAPSDLGLSQWNASDLYGGETIQEAAEIFTNILTGNYTEAQKEVVVANSAIAISTYEKIDFESAKAKAIESLDSGKALATLKAVLS